MTVVSVVAAVAVRVDDEVSSDASAVVVEVDDSSVKLTATDAEAIVTRLRARPSGETLRRLNLCHVLSPATQLKANPCARPVAPLQGVARL
jgi:hypothetical protein